MQQTMFAYINMSLNSRCLQFCFMKNDELAVDFWHLSPGKRAAAGPNNASNSQVSMIIWSSGDIVTGKLMTAKFYVCVLLHCL